MYIQLLHGGHTFPQWHSVLGAVRSHYKIDKSVWNSVLKQYTLLCNCLFIDPYLLSLLFSPISCPGANFINDDSTFCSLAKFKRRSEIKYVPVVSNFHPFFLHTFQNIYYRANFVSYFKIPRREKK